MDDTGLHRVERATGGLAGAPIHSPGVSRRLLQPTDGPVVLRSSPEASCPTAKLPNPHSPSVPTPR